MALQRGIVMLEEHNENWKEEYENEKDQLIKLIGKYIIEIHHVGSTSINKLKAKPIIDILIVIENLDQIEEIDNILKEYDYHNRGAQGVIDRIFFAKGPEEARTHYLHFTYPNSKTYYDQIYFKRYLNEHPEYIEKYCNLKQELAEKYAQDRKSYTAGKNEFITNIISLAKEEYND